MSQQPETVQYLCSIFENLDPKWIELLVSQFQTSDIEFLTEQCLERCQQINMEQEKTKTNHNHNKEDIPHHDNQASIASNLSRDQHDFLYSQQLIDSEDEVIMKDKITDVGPSLSLLSSVPKEIRLWFESFSKSLPLTFKPGLLEILLHLEMVKYNTTFAFSPKPNAAQTNDEFVQSLEFLLALLTKLETHFDDQSSRMLSQSDKAFRDAFQNVQGSEVLLKYAGWTLIEAEKSISDNDALYVYNEENDKQYLHAIIVLLSMYKDYLKGETLEQYNDNKSNMNDNNNNNNNAAAHKWKFPDNEANSNNKNNNFQSLSIFESDDDDKLDEKELILTPKDDEYVTRKQPSVDTPTQAKKIRDLIENIDVADLIPRDLNVNEFVLRQRAIVYGASEKAQNIYSHQWPPKIPGYALMKEHKQKNISIYTYTWDEFPSHRYKYLAMECELNKFARIGLNVFLRNCDLKDIVAGSDLGDIQIFCIPQDNQIQVSTEMGPFEKKLVFTVKFASHIQLPYSWKYNGRKVTLNDITQYIKSSNDMLAQAAEKYLSLYRRYDLHKVADKVATLYNILTQKLKVSCFIDLEFPPLTASLMSKTILLDEDSSAFEGLIWKRAIDFAEYPHLFGPAIMLSDVEQGKLGNCGFAASLTAISIYPQLIKKLFLFPDEESVSAIGLYEVTLCHNGIWRQYTIDDLIPCNYGGNAAFTRHENGNFLWVSLLEKCAAKSYGGYDRLIAFCKLNAFNDLTGCPVEEIDFDIFDDLNSVNFAANLWKHLVDWNDNKYTVMTLAATIERSKRSITDLGITGNHAFTFIRAVQVENIRLIQIRNPWGKCSANVRDRWKGDYSRYNKRGEWTQRLKAIVRPELESNDGTFWMCLRDFMQYFASASLCHLLVMNSEYKICKLSTKIEYNYSESAVAESAEDILYPKLILDLSAMDNSDCMELEWLGMQQDNLRSQYAIHHEYLDTCLLIAQLLYPNDRDKCMSDLAAYFEPIRITECRKSKTEFEKIYAPLRGGQKYLLIPYSTGITFHKNYKTLKKQQTRNVNISLYIKHKSGLHIDRDDRIKLEYQKSLNICEMKPILTHFVQQLGKKEASGDLEYISAAFGTLTLLAARHTKLEKIMGGTFSFDLVNMLPAIGFDQGFILKNQICNQIENEEKKQKEVHDNLGSREWKWIYTVQDLKPLETQLFVLGQYQRFRRQEWKFNPEIFFSSSIQNGNFYGLF